MCCSRISSLPPSGNSRLDSYFPLKMFALRPLPTSLQSRRIFSGYDTGYEYSMPPSWMIKLTEGWGEPKKDSEREDDKFKKEEGEGVGRGKMLSSTPLTHPSSTSPNSLLAAHSKWRPSNKCSNK